MASDLDNIKTRRSAILAELVAGTTPAGESFRQPDIALDGQNVPMVAYRLSLLAELKQLNELIAALEGPIEIESIALG